MSKLGGLLARKPIAEGDIARDHAEAAQSQRDDEAAVIGVDEELFTPAEQLAGEHEALRNLLLDAECRIGEIDTLKSTFGKLVEPINKALRQVEVEQAEKISLQSVLNNTRAAYTRVRSELTAAEKKITSYEAEGLRLKDELTAAQNTLRALESTKTEQSVEIVSQKAKLLELDRRLQHETQQKDSARDEGRRMSERLVVCDKRIVQLEADFESGRQKALVSERERTSLQTALDQAHEESARMSRRLVELEKAFSSTHARLLQTEAALAESNSERARVSASLDDAIERQRAETTSHNVRYDALSARAETTEKLLEEARQSLADRADELRAYDRRFAEASLTRQVLEGKLSDLDRMNTERDSQLEDLRQSKTTQIERNVALAKAVSTRELEIKRMEAKTSALADQIGLLENQLQLMQMKNEEQVETLTAELQREKIERSMAEGALEAGRKDLTRLLRELASLQARRESGDPLTLPKYNNAA